jgi:hypothetical protein
VPDPHDHRIARAQRELDLALADRFQQPCGHALPGLEDAAFRIPRQ